MTGARNDREAADERARLLEELARVGTWEWNVAADSVTWSDEMYRLFGVKADQFEATFDGYLSCLHPDDRAAARATVEHALHAGESYAADYRVRCPDGEQRWVHCRGRAVVDPSGAVIRLLGTTQDITERKQLEHHLVHQSLHDPLTGLPNRSLLLDRLTHAMQRTLRSKRHTAVFFIDLDRFKNVNDGAGHDTGDATLRAVARHLRVAMRKHDTVARYGGDEFVVVAEDLAWPEQAKEVSGRLLHAVAAPIAHDAGELAVTASIGATLADGHSDPNTVLRDADAAMYRAKHLGGHTVVWAEPL